MCLKLRAGFELWLSLHSRVGLKSKAQLPGDVTVREANGQSGFILDWRGKDGKFLLRWEEE